MRSAPFSRCILSLLLFLLVLPAALAVVDVTYNFNRANVEVSAYNCLDSTCSSVGPFSGEFPQGTSTTNGQLTIRYPSTLVSQFGYGMFYTSSGTLPVEGLATWHSFGDPAVFTTNVNTNFQQASQCKSTIDEFTVTNDARANIPLVIGMSASLDATTHSAFYLVNNEVSFIPPQYRNNYYSVDTTVRLQIYNENGQLVNEQSQAFVLFADNQLRVEFTWTPTLDGRYTARVTTEVTDNQCFSAIPQSAEKDFSVLAAAPSDQCYTLLNGLQIESPFPRVGESVVTSFGKISNVASSSGFLTSVPTVTQYTVAGPDGTVYANGEVLAANPDTVSPTAHDFTWTPSAEGPHTVTVHAQGTGALCAAARENLDEEERLNFWVSAQPAFDVSFQLVNSLNGSAVQGARVELGGAVLFADSTGRVSFANVASGTYDYVITATGYQSLAGSVTVIDSDINLLLPMDPMSVGQLHSATFVVTDAVTGVSVPTAVVSIAGQQVLTNDNGVAVVTGLQDAVYLYSVQHSGYAALSGSAQVAGADIFIPVFLVPILNGDYDVTVLVRDAQSFVPITGAFVAVDGASGFTDGSGLVTLGSFVPGVYGALASADGYQTGRATVEVIDSDVFVIMDLWRELPVPKDIPEVEVFISAIRILDAYDAHPRGQVEFVVQFRNNGEVDIDGMKATVVSQELGLRASVGMDDLDVGQAMTRRMILDVPYDAEPGEYPVRITLSSDKFKRIVYRDVVITK